LVNLSRIRETRAYQLSIFSKTNESLLKNSLDHINFKENYDVLLGPEIGSIMIQGRAGGTGDKFNLGEATLTKCIVKFQEKTGYSYHLGRNLIKSEYGAILDALMQIESYHSKLLIYVKEFQEQIQKEKIKIIADSSESKVDFFTMVRGD
jgi:alpha-D-ribose 1-methylphosphonate 5-triphosphate synthase subunit PhnG